MSEIANWSPTAVTAELRQPRPGAMVAAEQSRAIQEVQAAFVIAKQFPRDEALAEGRILAACERPSLAEQGEYAYPRGGQQVTGPSIRLAETIARFWGNLQYGVRELTQSPGVSEMEAFCHDLESNVRAVRVFQVRHVRHTKRGSSVLDDPRDVYELTANQGARRLRACILEVVPGDVVEAAVKQCRATLAGAGGSPIADRIAKMVAAFAEIGVTAEQIGARFGKDVGALIEADLVRLRQIYTSVKDGMSKAGDWFDPTGDQAAADLRARLEAAVPEAEVVDLEPELTPEDVARVFVPEGAKPSGWQKTTATIYADAGLGARDWAAIVDRHLQALDLPSLDAVPADVRKDFAEALRRDCKARAAEIEAGR